MGILWGVSAPKSACKSGVGIVTVRAGETLSGVILGPVVGVMTHFSNGRSAPCVGAQNCTFHQLELRWQGFLPFWASNRDWRGKRSGVFPCVLLVTKAIGEDIEQCSRGTVIEVSRGASKVNDPLSLIVKGQYKGELPLPDGFDVKPYVLRAAAGSTQRILRVHRA